MTSGLLCLSRPESRPAEACRPVDRCWPFAGCCLLWSKLVALSYLCRFASRPHPSARSITWLGLTPTPIVPEPGLVGVFSKAIPACVCALPQLRFLDISGEGSLDCRPVRQGGGRWPCSAGSQRLLSVLPRCLSEQAAAMFVSVRCREPWPVWAADSAAAPHAAHRPGERR